MVDYVIEFQKANGKKAYKVFKLKKLSVAAGESYSFIKTHRFPKDATTLKYYSGTHTVTLQINGAKQGSLSFELITSGEDA